jgi:hypothetical protein
MKLFLESLKTVFHVFAFFTKFLVTDIFNKYIIKRKIKFHAEVI